MASPLMRALEATEMSVFGETVYYAPMENKKGAGNKLDVVMKEGVYCGHTERSNEHWIGTEEGMVEARTYRRKPRLEEWDSRGVREM